MSNRFKNQNHILANIKHVFKNFYLGTVVKEVRTIFERLGDETVFIPVLTSV